MTDQFNPYHRWLGIPLKDQPPNHYRLLGLELLERDPKVILDAAERQIAHIRRYELGTHQELSQRILNELAEAKACLLNAAKKSQYDATLKQQLPPALVSELPGHVAASHLPPREEKPRLTAIHVTAC
jgi:hypothetical protein